MLGLVKKVYVFWLVVIFFVKFLNLLILKLMLEYNLGYLIVMDIFNCRFVIIGGVFNWSW